MFRFLTTLLLIGFAAADNTNTCSLGGCNLTNTVPVFPKEVCHASYCTTAIKQHIKEEFKAAFLYLHMGAMFAQDGVARPGIAKFMLESATEERSHANLMLDYLNKRGIKLTADEMGFDFNKEQIGTEGLTSMTMKVALEKALKMEIQVTNLIINVIEKCDCDYHAADVFTNPILDEQHDGIRKLQGVVREFEDLLHGQTDQLGLVEFIMDQKILKGGL